MSEFDEQTIDTVQSEPIPSGSEETAAATIENNTAAEDTVSLGAYRALVDSQTQTIRELTDRVVSLQTQLAKAIGSGAQFNDGKTEPLPDPEPMRDYTYLKDLDFSIDKHAR